MTCRNGKRFTARRCLPRHGCAGLRQNGISLMPLPSDQQSAFAAALRHADAPMPDAIAAHYPDPPRRRFNVYRNNVVVSLVEAMIDAYPVVLRLVGEDFFRATARVFVLGHPPASPVLLGYGAGFAEFVESFPPAAKLPYLADVARLEWAWLAAYHAAEAEPVDIAVLAGIPETELSDTAFDLHPSLGLVTSSHPIVSIFAANRRDETVGPIDLSIGEDALVIRPAAKVVVRHLPDGGHAFIDALREGKALGEAAEIGIAASFAFDLSANLRGLFEAGAVVGLKTPAPR
ncbi:MAG: putative DNA-binding domain-containing protein [Hyphomicrobiales bacterium]|nr:putative DNA-binding domain-containing protein [Hyphomicrobiales bacterium]